MPAAVINYLTRNKKSITRLPSNYGGLILSIADSRCEVEIWLAAILLLAY